MPDRDRDEDDRPRVELAERPAAEPLLGESILGGPGAAAPLVAAPAPGANVPAGPAFGIPNPVRRRAPGRATGGEEAARAIGRIDLPEDEARRGAELLANMRTEGLVPEFNNAQAMALRARRRAMPGPAMQPRAIQAPEPVRAIAAAPAQRPAAIAAPAAANVPVPAVPRPQEPPRNLPALVAGQDVALRAAPFPQELPEPRWFTVYDAPGYLQAAIRELGNRTFGTFPCYQRHRNVERERGEDPVGAVHFLAAMPGLNTAAEINQVAGWIMENGLPMSPHQIAIPAIPGYEPRVILATDEDTSYLMVDERVEDGAPGNRRYIYSWTGGTRWYLDHPEAVAALRDLRRPGALPPPAARLPGRGPAQIAPPAARRGVGHGGVPVPARAALPALPASPAINVDEERRRRARTIAALPKAGAPKIAGELARAVREAGFGNSITDGRPSLVRELDDGGLAVVQPLPGRSFADSPSLVGRIVSASGAAGPDTPLERLSDIEAFLETPAAPAP